MRRHHEVETTTEEDAEESPQEVFNAEPPEGALALGNLPLWREALLVCALMLFLAFGGKLFDLEADIYASAPSIAVPREGRTYPVRVNDGYLRYVTQQQSERVQFWRNMTPAMLLALFGTAAITLGTYRQKRPGS